MVVREVERAARRLPAARNEAVAELEEQGIPAAHGCRSAAALLRQLVTAPPPRPGRGSAQADDLVRGRCLSTGEPLPARLPAWRERSRPGSVGGAGAVVRRAMAGIPAAVDEPTRVAAEQKLVDHARTMDPAQLSQVAARVLACLDPDGALGSTDASGSCGGGSPSGGRTSTACTPSPACSTPRPARSSTPRSSRWPPRGTPPEERDDRTRAQRMHDAVRRRRQDAAERMTCCPANRGCRRRCCSPPPLTRSSSGRGWCPPRTAASFPSTTSSGWRPGARGADRVRHRRCTPMARPQPTPRQPPPAARAHRDGQGMRLPRLRRPRDPLRSHAPARLGCTAGPPTSTGSRWAATIITTDSPTGDFSVGAGVSGAFPRRGSTPTKSPDSTPHSMTRNWRSRPRNWRFRAIVPIVVPDDQRATNIRRVLGVRARRIDRHDRFAYRPT